MVNCSDGCVRTTTKNLIICFYKLKFADSLRVAVLAGYGFFSTLHLNFLIRKDIDLNDILLQFKINITYMTNLFSKFYAINLKL